ncbi:transcriptional activator NhaR [Marinobacter nanhaiticus D15-8W]|uniref:LysR family transcriptional regulator n=1 Tax=Marinobacter nanhaiticus D15-8W TaxID=626887 RepID=N6W5P1_9GAMM|nr:LysR family transcriptional regulator [Marinobacter nanhaiticus]ENO15529.1 LysR family transcriptional regulator [Marinobacter nanhaiticus D15-8W]BES73621.1 transcriptional activator NhaR [Marinobacter nanhaiticus D15-8W]
MLDTLNFRHLYYFWVIAHEGSLAQASERLDLAPQTLSGQLASLEQAVGGLLFRRESRRLFLTDLGRTVLGYADEMFSVADELCQVVQSAPEDRPLKLVVGVSASIHKLIAYHLIEPALTLDRDVQLTCRTARIEDLLRDLARQQLDVLLTDRVPLTDAGARWHLHELGQSGISLFAAPALAQRLTPGYPASLNGQPFLANALDAPYLHQLTRWFSEQGVRLKVRAEIDDSALIKVFGRQGQGVFAAPTLIADEVCRQYEVACLGHVEGVTDHLYAITRTRQSTHPAVEAICRQRITARR